MRRQTDTLLEVEPPTDEEVEEVLTLLADQSEVPPFSRRRACPLEASTQRLPLRTRLALLHRKCLSLAFLPLSPC